jgi:hypothetical protein
MALPQSFAGGPAGRFGGFLSPILGCCAVFADNSATLDAFVPLLGTETLTTFSRPSLCQGSPPGNDAWREKFQLRFGIFSCSMSGIFDAREGLL